METQIKIVAKLYECRDTAKSLAKLQDRDYEEMLKPYKKVIQRVMEVKKTGKMPALLKISKTKTFNDDGMTQLLFMAALVELIEPSK